MAVTLAGAGLMVVALAGAPSAAATPEKGACAEGTGVTVVVDFTELGGSVEAGCAESDAVTGRAALLAAGFTATNSGQGLICAIDVKPDPCPATFNGSFWSYWHSAGDGSWTSYQVGADASHPLPGELEGWRYNDGAAGPGIAPSEVMAAPQSAATTSRTADLAEATNTGPLFITLGVAAVVILTILLLAAGFRRRRAAAGD